MQSRRLRILVLSDLFPNPVRPAFGIFVERQVFHLQSACDNVVVVPTRVFPHLRIWKQLLKPRRFLAEWRKWRAELKQIPDRDEANGIRVFYPRYTSPPMQVFHGVWGFFAYLFLRRRLLALHRERPFDLIHAHYASPSGVIALLARRWMKVPVVLTIHGSDITYTAKQNRLSAAVIRWTFRQADIIMANSHWTAQQIVYYGGDPNKVQIVYYGGDPNKVQIVQLGSDPPKHLVQRQLSEYDEATVLLSVGYLEERKGHAYVLKALSSLVRQGYKVRYVIVGDGTQEAYLQQLTNDLGLVEIVSFEGYKAHRDVWPYFRSCDIFVLPSWDEAFGLVYIEALAVSKPVVGCEGEGGPEDLHALGDCIELVKPKDVESLTQALKRLLDDPERRRQMGELGCRIVAEYFTWERNAANTVKIYQQAIKVHSA